MKGNDYVYTLPITEAHAAAMEAVNNRAAALPFSLPYQPLRWTPITMLVNPMTHTISTLFGDDVAIRALPQRGRDVSGATHYGPGAVLSLVSWAQRDDPHWFGGRIPDQPTSVEFVVLDSQARATYRTFNGTGLSEQQLAKSDIARRISDVLGLKPVALP